MNRRILRDLPAYLAFAWSVVVLWKAHYFFVVPTAAMLHHLDEGYVNAFAWRMIEGRWLPYVDAVSHRGPMMYWAMAIALKLGSPTSWVPMRILSMICGVGTVVFTFLSAWRAGRTLAGAVAAVAIVAAFLVGMDPIDGIAYSGEHLLNLFAMAGFFVLVVALDRARPSIPLVALAGALVALGALAKQLGAATIAPLGLWVLVVGFAREPLERRMRWLLPTAFAAGVALPVVVVLVRYAVAGELHTLFYYTVTYNAKVYLAPYTPEMRAAATRAWLANHGVLLGIFLPIGAWGITRPLVARSPAAGFLRAYDAHGFCVTVALTAILDVAVSNSALRDFPHYYVQLVPWCGLLLGMLLDSTLDGDDASGLARPSLVRAAVLLPAVAVLTAAIAYRFDVFSRDRVEGRRYAPPRPSAICDYVHANVKPDEPLFVWGFLPHLYTECGRRPASRFVFTTFVAGLVPWFENTTLAEDEARAVPGSREQLVSDLEQSRPPVIVDAGRMSLGDRPMRRYEALAKYLDAHYCAAPPVEAFDIYVRKGAAGCPSPPR